jgi:hypothetical protein
MVTLTIDGIRQQYPTPMRDRDRPGYRDIPGTYCVGGAICLAARDVLACVEGEDITFPTEYELACVLADLNPDLDDAEAQDMEDTEAMTFASAIIEDNEQGDFASAWKMAAQALAYRSR